MRPRRRGTQLERDAVAHAKQWQQPKSDLVPQVGAVVWDHRTGYVEAFVGGLAWNLRLDQFDRMTQACRQPGSAWKPLVYGAALDRGAITPGTALRDAPVAEYDEATNTHWKPHSSGKFRGVVTKSLLNFYWQIREANLRDSGVVFEHDTVWLDESTLLVGIGYRTNPAAIAALAEAFPGVEVVAFDLPHWNGRDEVMHLMSLISPLDRDLAAVYPRIAPVRLLDLLAERGIEIVEVPDEEFATQGPNVLALGPRQALALDGNRRRADAWSARASRWSSTGDEISKKGDGGRPASRDRCFEPERASGETDAFGATPSSESPT